MTCAASPSAASMSESQWLRQQSLEVGIAVEGLSLAAGLQVLLLALSVRASV